MNRKNIPIAVLVGLLLAALIQVVIVGERILAAGWQWYAFRESGGGYIMLGWTMAKVFYGLSLPLLVLSALYAKSVPSSSPTWTALKWLPASLFTAGTIAYTALAWGPLNQWRP